MSGPQAAAAGSETVLAGRWQLKRTIGSGAAGVLWQASDLETYADVAVKIARRPGYSFAGEAEVQLSVQSPYIAGVLGMGDSGHDESTGAFLVQELVPGLNLRDMLRRTTPHNVDVTAWAYGLLRALQSLHSAGIVHRDIKPSNIMIPLTAGGSPSPQPKLVDFGTAARLPECDDDASSRGTVLYMSPEQARGHGVGPASDMYSLGLVLLECLTGSRAFSLPTLESLVARTLRNPVIPAYVPASWHSLIRAMTAMDPAMRPAPAAALEMLTHPTTLGAALCTGSELALAV